MIKSKYKCTHPLSLIILCIFRKYHKTVLDNAILDNPNKMFKLMMMSIPVGNTYCNSD